ncbi:dolichyl-phosphate-mannose-protein mannosyltransferase [Heliophilum fasciatum]|uniref:Dolichyl-phosphate-mannose-protein mannosyltransferase n=2 Tax=Heliophilum fasciatum TaxID=35700 RepID=A0A4R2RWW0_9FIRM|nr:dolichyl-phosphate-mannose-protein mannosyltransferase [Heliophilum fasciatum]
MTLVMLAGLIVRLPGIDQPLTDFHGWRQCDTAAVARFFYEREMNIVRPQLPYAGAPPNYAELELGLAPMLAAWGYRLVGEQVWVARSVVIGFSLVSLVAMFRIGRAMAGDRAGLLAAGTLALHPVYVYFSRSFQPDVPMIALALSAWAALLSWAETGRKATAGWAIVLFTLAVLVKPPALLFAVPMAVVWWQARWVKKWVAAGLILVPAAAVAAYLGAVHAVAEHPFVSGLAQGALTRLLQEGILASWWRECLRGGFFFVLTPFFLWPALVGLGRLLAGPWALAMGLWIVALLSFFLLVGEAVLYNLQYYYLPAIPLVALAVAAALDPLVLKTVPLEDDTDEQRATAEADWQMSDDLGEEDEVGLTVAERRWLATVPVKKRRWRQQAQAKDRRLLAVLLLGLTVVSWWQLETWLPAKWREGEPWRYDLWYHWEERPVQIGQAVDRTVPVDALVVMAVEESPRTLFYGRRFGWFVEPQDCTPEYLQQVIGEGAAFLIWNIEGPPPGGEAARWMDEGFWLIQLARSDGVSAGF